ncbi:MAG: hypothetical protein NVSMB68_09760 [Thermoanaerobaculia bacterium]
MCSLLPVALLAQNAPTPKPELFLIHEEVAKPSMLGQYESVTRELLNLFAEKHADPKVFGMNNYMTTDFHYLFVVPIANWAALDTFQQSWMALGQAVGKDRWSDLMNRGNAAMSSYNEFVVAKRSDLSYMPATPRLKQSEVGFVRWAFYYIDASKPMEDVEQVAKDYAALFRSKNVPDPFTVYQAMNGSDLPLLIVAIPARDAADFWAEDQRVNSMVGADVRPLQVRAMRNTRRYELRDGTVRRDLSYPPPAAPAAAAVK